MRVGDWWKLIILRPKNSQRQHTRLMVSEPWSEHVCNGPYNDRMRGICNIYSSQEQYSYSRVATKIFEDLGGTLCKEFIRGQEPASIIVHYTRPGSSIKWPPPSIKKSFTESSKIFENLRCNFFQGSSEKDGDCAIIHG